MLPAKPASVPSGRSSPRRKMSSGPQFGGESVRALCTNPGLLALPCFHRHIVTGAVHQIGHAFVIGFGVQCYYFDVIHEGPPLF